MVRANIHHKRRLWFSLFFICLVFAALIGRLAYLQLVKNEEYSKKAIHQQMRTVTLPAKRGTIYDRNMTKLAFSVETYTVEARPGAIEDVADTAAQISDILEMDSLELERRIRESAATSFILKRWITKDQADLIRGKRIRGIDVNPDTKRVYPNGSLASRVIGFTDVDEKGLVGLELKYNTELTGKPGKRIVSTDVVGRQLPFGTDKRYEPVHGNGLVLTIDEVIQHFTEQALKESMEIYGPKRAMAIVMDVETGGILSMASYPNFDLSDPRDMSIAHPDLDVSDFDQEALTELWNKTWSNPLISEIMDPGSTFKVLTTAMALEENVATPNSKFSTVGYMEYGSHRLRNWDYPAQHKNFTLTRALEASWNTTFMELVERLGKETFYDYLKNFGLMDRTGVDFNGEAYPMVLPIDRPPYPIDLATMSYGHTNSYSPLQMVTALNAIANDGKLVTPHFVKAYTNVDGEVVEEVEANVVKEVVSTKTAREVLLMMESVVVNGSGKSAYIPGIRIGGKTGTSMKIVDGKYSDKLATASFTAIAPIDDPKITMLVILDEPTVTNYGSQTAAPVAGEILRDTLRYLGIEPELSAAVQEVKVPNLIGKTYEQAELILEAAGLQWTTEPMVVQNKNALVQAQFPYPGTIVDDNAIVILDINDLPPEEN